MSVFYLKYRPRKIKELDLLGVKKRLEFLLASENKPQTWLFAGPRGSGKTSAARILARHLNCLSLEGIEPCGKCRVCQQIESGAGVDVVEMDGASNRGIDDVRALKENVHLAPISFRNKVFIVDEVHMMTKEAFNALLKILEEPPAHVTFILCTTDPEKIPVTVLSRLTRIDFYKGSKEEVLSALEKAVKGEKIKVKKEVLEELAGSVDGSFRDAHKILSVLVSESGGEIKKKDLDRFLKRSGLGKEREFLKLVSGGSSKTKEILLMFSQMADSGVSFSDFRQNLLKRLQEEMVYLLAGVGEGLGLDFSKEELAFLIKCLLKAADWEKGTVLSELPLELAVLDYFKEDKEGHNSERKSKEKEDKKTFEKVEDKKKIFETRKKEDVREVELKPVFDKTDFEKIQKLWSEVLLAVRPHNHSVEAFLRASRPLRIDKDRLVIEVFYQFHKDRLEDERNREVVEKGLSSVLGRDYKLFCELGDISRVKTRVEEELVNENNGEKEKSFPEKKAKEEEDDLYQVAKELFG